MFKITGEDGLERVAYSVPNMIGLSRNKKSLQSQNIMIVGPITISCEGGKKCRLIKLYKDKKCTFLVENNDAKHWVEVMSVPSQGVSQSDNIFSSQKGNKIFLLKFLGEFDEKGCPIVDLLDVEKSGQYETPLISNGCRVFVEASVDKKISPIVKQSKDSLNIDDLRISDAG